MGSAGNATMNMRMYHGIKATLNKIVLLTLMNEISSSIVLVLSLLNQYIRHNDKIAIFFNTAGAIDVAICALTAFLMQKHNQHNYRMFVMFLGKMNLTMCCQSMIADVEPSHAAIAAEIVMSQTNNTSKSPTSQMEFT